MSNEVLKIKTFDDVDLSRMKNGLLVLDIDETILKFENIDSKWQNQVFNKEYNLHSNYELAETNSLNIWFQYIQNNCNCYKL